MDYARTLKPLLDRLTTYLTREEVTLILVEAGENIYGMNKPMVIAGQQTTDTKPILFRSSHFLKLE